MFVDVPGPNTHTHFYRLKFHIRQECVVAIVRVMEAYASTGIVCHYSRYIVCTSRTLRNTYMYSFTITFLKLYSQQVIKDYCGTLTSLEQSH